MQLPPSGACCRHDVRKRLTQVTQTPTITWLSVVHRTADGRAVRPIDMGDGGGIPWDEVDDRQQYALLTIADQVDPGTLIPLGRPTTDLHPPTIYHWVRPGEEPREYRSGDLLFYYEDADEAPGDFPPKRTPVQVRGKRRQTQPRFLPTWRAGDLARIAVQNPSRADGWVESQGESRMPGAWQLWLKLRYRPRPGRTSPTTRHSPGERSG